MKKSKTVNNFYQLSKCKICNQNGIKIYSKSFNDKIFRNFFSSYYGLAKYKKLSDKIKTINYELLKCKDCEFIWQKNTPKKNLNIDLYENIIDKEISLEKSKLKYLKKKINNKKEIQKIISFFNINKINILDFGAGWGHWLMSGLGLNCNSYALELSPSRKKFIIFNKINILNLTDIDLFKKFFHYIRLDQVLEHLDKPGDVLEMIKNLGNKNCIYYISVPDGSEVIKKENIHKIAKGPVQPLEHLNCFSKKSLIKILDIHGFRPLKLSEIVIINFKDLTFDITSFKSFFLDIKNHFFSTSIKFKLKNR